MAAIWRNLGIEMAADVVALAKVAVQGALVARGARLMRTVASSTVVWCGAVRGAGHRRPAPAPPAEPALGGVASATDELCGQGVIKGVIKG
ncbi:MULTISPECIES: hypothetical protein [unclassified Streptomyces]|uniref:hypothetical protein n=1 Tax=unclassified Streptomyces TaxID=2593676 RepID=UPI0036EF91EA